MDDTRLQVVASIGTRLALGVFPLAFIVVFGWAYGKSAFDLAAAAANSASYLNVFLLSGFVLVPPTVARLRAGSGGDADRSLLRDHLALLRTMLALAAVMAAGLWVILPCAFPALAAAAGARLGLWFALLALLAWSQIAQTFWLGIAQAAGHYVRPFLLLAVPRAAVLLGVPLAATAGVEPTWVLAVASAAVLLAQARLGTLARRALRAIDDRVFAETGSAVRVLAVNLSAGSVSLVGMLVTVVPVTLVGALQPTRVGEAHVVVSLSNAFGTLLVAALFPASLRLGSLHDPAAQRAHYWRVARAVAVATAAALAVGLLAFPICRAATPACSGALLGIVMLVIIGAGLRLASLGVYHAAVFQGRPQVTLLSVAAEGVAVVGLSWWLLPTSQLFALGVAFMIGGSLRLLIALTGEATLLARLPRSSNRQ